MFGPKHKAYRDLLLDPVIINALQYALESGGSDNPLFTRWGYSLRRRDYPGNPGTSWC